VDHMHVHGLQGKFSQPDEEVIASAQDCYTPLTPEIDGKIGKLRLSPRPRSS